jgi:hypothetical protein
MQTSDPYNKDKLDDKILYLEYAIKELEEYISYKKEHNIPLTFENTIDTLQLQAMEKYKTLLEMRYKYISDK